MMVVMTIELLQRVITLSRSLLVNEMSYSWVHWANCVDLEATRHTVFEHRKFMSRCNLINDYSNGSCLFWSPVPQPNFVREYGWFLRVKKFPPS